VGLLLALSACDSADPAPAPTRYAPVAGTYYGSHGGQRAAVVYEDGRPPVAAFLGRFYDVEGAPAGGAFSFSLHDEYTGTLAYTYRGRSSVDGDTLVGTVTDAGGSASSDGPLTLVRRPVRP
jgi:hypothetical protein